MAPTACARHHNPTLLAAARRPDPSAWEIVLVGDGPGRSDFEALARETGVADRVRFEGFVPDKARTILLEGADVLCLPSAQEGFGIVFLEAMLAGRPVRRRSGGSGARGADRWAVCRHGGGVSAEAREHRRRVQINSVLQAADVRSPGNSDHSRPSEEV